MKIKSFFAMALAMAVLFVSCSSEDDPVGNGGGDGADKSFFIQIGKQGVKTRAEGSDVAEGSSVQFADGYLVFSTNNKIGRVIKIVNNATTEEDEVNIADLETGTEIGKIPASTNKVFVYGNLGSSLNGIVGAAVKDGSVSNIEALVWALADIQNAANDVTKVPVYGNGVVSAGSVTGTTERLESKFDVAPIASRLQLGKVTCTDTRVTELTLAGIYINAYYHSMEAGRTFKPEYMLNHGIDVSKYPSTGYPSPYNTMSDILTSKPDIAISAATPSAGKFWAYNFFPAEMPHIVLHFATLKTNDEAALDVTNKYATVAKYSNVEAGGTGNEFTTALAGNVYTLNVNISDYTKQIDELPEANSSVMGYVDIDVITWKAKTIYPEW